MVMANEQGRLRWPIRPQRGPVREVLRGSTRTAGVPASADFSMMHCRN